MDGSLPLVLYSMGLRNVDALADDAVTSTMIAAKMYYWQRA
jgi:hypothetical protein